MGDNDPRDGERRELRHSRPHQLSDSEVRELLEMLEDYKRRRWALALILSTSKWITSVAATIALIQYGLSKWLLSK